MPRARSGRRVGMPALVARAGRLLIGLAAAASLLALRPGSGSAVPAHDAAPTPGVDLLRPQPGGAGSGGLPVFLAGPADGMTPDALEPNDGFEQAAAIAVGAVYRQLNFVAGAPGAADGDFYWFRAKPGNCYLAQTGDLAPGLDTTILLWRAAPTREGRRLVAQNDDSRAHTADLSSAARWCSPADAVIVVEIHNYGWAPATDPRGKTYSLAVQIDPPSPTPTAPPRPPPPAVPPVPAGAAAALVPPAHPAPVISAAPAPTRTPAPPPATPTATATPLAVSPTPTAPLLAVDVVAYVAGADAPGPLQGDGIVGWPVQLVDRQSNAVLQTALTDANGHARLSWVWRGPVWVELPTLRWSRLVIDPQTDLALTGGPLYARKEAYPLPGVWP